VRGSIRLAPTIISSGSKKIVNGFLDFRPMDGIGRKSKPPARLGVVGGYYPVDPMVLKPLPSIKPYLR
jgi:hypothetical protein